MYIVREGSAVTADYRTDRVRIYVGSRYIVVSTPRIGWFYLYKYHTYYFYWYKLFRYFYLDW